MGYFFLFHLKQLYCKSGYIKLNSRLVQACLKLGSSLPKAWFKLVFPNLESSLKIALFYNLEANFFNLVQKYQMMIIKSSYIVEWMLDNKNKMFLKIPYFLARGSARLGSRNSQLGSAREKNL